MNACRYQPNGRGHVESYFLRANDPLRPRALWLKATILAPRGVRREAVAEAWAIYFDGEQGRTLAHRETRPLSQSSFELKSGTGIEVARCTMALSENGSAAGQLDAPGGRLSWQLDFTREPGAIGAPLSLYPHRLFVDGPFPKSKLLTPMPALRVSGRIEAFGERVDVEGWRGMQGHNWGREHPFEYAWGQCLFAGDRGVDAMVEAFTGRLRVAGRPSPAFSSMVVRRGERELRFDRIFDLWRQNTRVSPRRWTLAMRGDAGEAELSMDVNDAPLVCLGYRNPDGRLAYCLNTKLAKTRLFVRPKGEDAFTLESAHGGALEFLRPTPDERITEVV